jgi:hypothetical protein
MSLLDEGTDPYLRIDSDDSDAWHGTLGRELLESLRYLVNRASHHRCLCRVIAEACPALRATRSLSTRNSGRDSTTGRCSERRIHMTKKFGISGPPQ